MDNESGDDGTDELREFDWEKELTIDKLLVLTATHLKCYS